MAHHIAFDTLKFVETLKASGMPESQAKALSNAQQEAFAEALDNSLATKSDIAEVKAEISTLKTEMKMLQWMLGFSIVGILTIIIKTFF